jgi:hypothetical protein
MYLPLEIALWKKVLAARENFTGALRFAKLFIFQ